MAATSGDQNGKSLLWGKITHFRSEKEPVDRAPAERHCARTRRSPSAWPMQYQNKKGLSKTENAYSVLASAETAQD